MANELSQSGRVTYVVAVSQGNVSFSQPGAGTWTVAENATSPLTTPPLNFSGTMMSAPNGQKLYFADGVNYCFWDGNDTKVHTWANDTQDLYGANITSLLPVDDQNNTPRLICTWRGRTVLSGLIGNPQVVFMSAVNQPGNFDYSPVSTTPTQAVALTSTSTTGTVGDNVTALIPYTDDLLIIGCENTIVQLSGDPLNGGTLDWVSKKIGIAFGQAFTQDPYGTIYFFSNGCGLYTYTPGAKTPPMRISQPVEKLFSGIDTGLNSIRLEYDDAGQGVFMFVTLLTNQAVTDHFYYELRSGSWWKDRLGSTAFNPLATCSLQGNTQGDRQVLIGGWSGYVYIYSPDATDDDGSAFTSYVLIGPILTTNMDVVLLKDMQAALGVESGDVTFQVLTGNTPEEAIASTPAFEGTWSDSLNLTRGIRRSGHAIYVKITSMNRWTLESIRARLQAQGKVQMRGK